MARSPRSRAFPERGANSWRLLFCESRRATVVGILAILVGAAGPAGAELFSPAASRETAIGGGADRAPEVNFWTNRKYTKTAL